MKVKGNPCDNPGEGHGCPLSPALYEGDRMKKGQERWWPWDGRWHPRHLIEHQEGLEGEK